MTSSKSILATLAEILLKALRSDRPSQTPVRPRRPDARLRPPGEEEADHGRDAGIATTRVDPDVVRDLRIGYSPDQDGAPDAGEIVWTWVPYEENDGRGKDRPVLIIGRASADRVYAVRMTSRSHDGDRDYLPIGSGSWDSQGRESWIDIEQLYLVHEDGLRREAAVLDQRRYGRVATALSDRYGWRAEQ
ncbi:type II toxin-antitoxin system PemK/MazF family toxin [Microbacterium aurantiacum]|uniref:type II toxin-antitoxin system PemK/MazF family toxin n=1 Tax=Microbacterium aurantiacum TaxID=162393 RepID=UPI000C8083A6|nr:type II toxin-antitoxin system PemK/MazF family toxin [Microbacterium aurantiacum]